MHIPVFNHNQASKRHNKSNSFQYLRWGFISEGAREGFMIIIGCIFLIQVDGSITGGGGELISGSLRS